MQEGNKLPLKRVELSLTKFNEVAIPHHLNLLRQHKANIIKYEEACDYARVRSEQTHARRVASQLRTLLGELDSLRRQVRAEDVAEFDGRTQRSRDLTLRAIMDYLGVIERSCIALVRGRPGRVNRESSPMCMRRGAEATAAPGGSTDSVGVLSHADTTDTTEQIQLQIDEQELYLREREAVLRGWGDLQAELRALHDAWQTVQAAALAHKTQVHEVSKDVQEASDNVESARRHLAVAERLRCGTYGVLGAVAGAAAGGPVGLALGLKAGAAAALASSLVGYLAGRVFGRKRQAQLEESTDDTKTTGDAEHRQDVRQETTQQKEDKKVR
ncbi:uncharacterized protein LOC133319733 isoform X1 [Danaus plexippus]|uniref:Syntaxin-17 n=1 Tax=Danaus plexippus plexippus TaxID=278856 RepID=A0A212ENV0_DANPL|nr:uncharacterized protein LOC133319733 isoform X1 [Danaus plexippus]OWR43185.1 Syntaxin-17 [Danaus plexippus plexippus]